jgi:GAF domain-containing protein
MFEAIISVIEEKGETLASEWLAELDRRSNVLAAARNRRQLWNDAKTWVTLLLRAMRTSDIAPLHRASRLTARRLAVGGFPAGDAVEAILAFKAVLWRELHELPGAGSEPLLTEFRLLGEWFDGVTVSMVENYGTIAQAETSRSAVVDRAKQLARHAEEESAISHLAQEMASERDARRLLDLVARSAAHLVGAQKAAVSVPEGHSLRYHGAYRLPLSYLNNYVRRAGQPLSGPYDSDESARVVEDFTSAGNGLREQAAQKLGVRAALRAPMRVADRDIGLIELFNPITDSAWTARDVDLVQELAAQGALAIENARLLAGTEQRARELSALNELGREFASGLSSPNLVDLAVRGAAHLLRAHSALLWLRVSGTSRFELRASHGPNQPVSDTHFTLGNGPLADAVSGKVGPLAAEARDALGWERGPAIAAPLRIGARVLGLVAIHRRQAPFDEDDLRILDALSGQIVVAMQNAELYEQSQALGQRLNASIAALGEALAAALDMQELLQVIVDKGGELTDAAAAILFLEDDSGHLSARAVSARGEGPAAAANPKAYERLAALAIESGVPITVRAGDQNADARLRKTMKGEHVRGAYGCPLMIKGRLAGALCILKRGRGLRTQERDLLCSFSRQAAVGIENVMLFGETQQRLGDLAELSRASARVSATLEQTAITEIVIESVARALRVPVAAIALLDGGGELFLPEGGHRGLPPTFVRHFAVRPDSIAFSVIGDQRIKIIADIAKEERGDDSLIEGLNLASLICAPLKGRTGVLGVIFAADYLPRTFRSHEEALMSAYANEAALALQNAFHHQAVASHARELEGILEATKALSSTLELQPVLDHLARAAASLLDVPVCSIRLLDETSGVLRTAAACGLAPDHELLSDLRGSEGIAGRVATDGVAIRSTDLPRDGRFRNREAARAEGLLSMLSVPLIAKGTPLGVISVYSRGNQPFTSAQERVLTTLAAEAAVAIDNARLYSKAREQARSMRNLIEEVNHRIKNNLQSTIGIIDLHISQVQEPQVRQALQEIAARVQAIAVTEELLFDEDVQAIDVKETGRRVLDNALRANANPQLKLTGQVTGARVRLPSRKATPLASIINELVYNSVTHAFDGRDQGTITVSFQEATGGQILVQVSDDGIGLPEGFSLARDAKLGLRIVEGLVTRDLAGEFSIVSNGGTIARVKFEK